MKTTKRVRAFMDLIKACKKNCLVTEMMIFDYATMYRKYDCLSREDFKQLSRYIEVFSCYN